MAKRALPWLLRRYRVYAAIRSEADAPALRAIGVTPIRIDLDRRGTLSRLAGLGDLVMHFAPPPEGGSADPRTRRLCAALARRASVAQRLVYISTTGVYGDCGGQHVPETRPVHPETPRAARRVDAERVLRAFGRRNRASVSILRAPGIYAADRLPVERIRRRDPVLRGDEDVFTNHIHAEDLARVACLALARGRSNRVYNVSDDSDLKMGDYFDLVARVFGLEPPPRVTREEARQRLSPMTLSFMRESRRLVNRRLKRELGVSLRYPDVFRGLEAARRAGG